MQDVWNTSTEFSSRFKHWVLYGQTLSHIMTSWTPYQKVLPETRNSWVDNTRITERWKKIYRKGLIIGMHGWSEWNIYLLNLFIFGESSVVGLMDCRLDIKGKLPCCAYFSPLWSVGSVLFLLFCLWIFQILMLITDLQLKQLSFFIHNSCSIIFSLVLSFTLY